MEESVLKKVKERNIIMKKLEVELKNFWFIAFELCT